MPLSPKEISALLDKELRSVKIDNSRNSFYRIFDKSFIFLLSSFYENLFELGPNELVFNCKGCRAKVMRWERKLHFEEHKREYDRIKDI